MSLFLAVWRQSSTNSKCLHDKKIIPFAHHLLRILSHKSSLAFLHKSISSPSCSFTRTISFSHLLCIPSQESFLQMISFTFLCRNHCFKDLEEVYVCEYWCVCVWVCVCVRARNFWWREQNTSCSRAERARRCFAPLIKHLFCSLLSNKSLKPRFERERESVCVCVCERESKCVCVCVPPALYPP